MVPKGCFVFLILAAVAVVLIGIFLIIFPYTVYPSIVRSQLHLSHAEDGSLPTLTYYWSKLPADTSYNYYFFNITNRDEVMYQNAMPDLVEIGPYSYKEWEFKEGVQWLENDNKIHFQNNKSFAYDQANSCSYCTHKDMVTLPNAAYMSILTLLNQNKALPNIAVLTTIFDLLALLLGEQPMRTVPVAGILYDSYNDPLIDLTTSNLTKMLAPDGKLLGVQLPDIEAMGYFPYYNHTNDETYKIHSGKADVYKTGQIVEWAGNTSLAWWGDEYSASLEGSSDGSFNKANLKKTDKIKMYQSYACRTFRMTYTDQDTVRGIKSYIYKLESFDYDTTIELNRGYRYENTELVDYFPTWPCGANHQYNGSCQNTVDCTLSANWCSSCCNGTHYKDQTVFMPPGVVPLRCLPGQKKRLPFAGFLSPPHFLQSPLEVTSSMRGVAPDPELHEPAKFYINPLTGSTVKAAFRMQLVVPIYNRHNFLLSKRIRNAFLPSFWVDIKVDLKKYAVNYIKTVTVIIPDIALGIGIGLLVIGLSCILTTFLCAMRRTRRDAVQKFEVEPVPAISATQPKDDVWT